MTSTSRGSEWLSPAKVQEILAIGRTKMYSMLATGEIPAVQIGRVLRISRAELDEWLERNRYRS